MDVAAFLNSIRHSPGYAGQLEHVEVLPERPGQFAEPEMPLASALVELLAARGIQRLYSHQVAALELARQQRDLVVVTGTASGKTLCYNLPILETVLAKPDARALYLFPTKALAQDQHKNLLELLSGSDASQTIASGVFDGDTPTAQRRRIQAEAQLVLSNPDMLHATILPYHPKWSRFFGSLRYVVIDEIHTYRGILGANVACVLRRLARICEHYGSKPVVLAASATIANPGELAGKLIGRNVAVVDGDGAPRGRKYFALWNPAPWGQDRLARRGPTDDAVLLMVEAMEAGAGPGLHAYAAGGRAGAPLRQGSARDAAFEAGLAGAGLSRRILAARTTADRGAVVRRAIARRGCHQCPGIGRRHWIA